MAAEHCYKCLIVSQIKTKVPSGGAKIVASQNASTMHEADVMIVLTAVNTVLMMGTVLADCSTMGSHVSSTTFV